MVLVGYLYVCAGAVGGREGAMVVGGSPVNSVSLDKTFNTLVSPLELNVYF